MKNYLKSFNILTDDEIGSFERVVKYKHLKKGDFFIKEGEISREVAFVISGLFR